VSARPDEHRCTNCGALLAEEATWCGQCFTPVAQEADEVPEPVPEPATTGRTARAVEARTPALWPCGVCGGQNPLELDACATCGTPFAALMREDVERPHVEPKDALTWSLLFPGLGHRKLGRGVDGLVHAILFIIAISMVVLLALGGVPSGPALAVFALFLVMVLVVYVGSAFDAHRLAQGGRALATPRTLLWVLVGVIVSSLALLALAVVSASKG
jgi:hypothetical protein